MFEGFIDGLIFAWILSLFGVDLMVISSAKEVFNITISISTYYIGFGLLGFIGAILHRLIRISSF